MKKFFNILFTMSLSTVLVACGGENNTQEPQTVYQETTLLEIPADSVNELKESFPQSGHHLSTLGITGYELWEGMVEHYVRDNREIELVEDYIEYGLQDGVNVYLIRESSNGMFYIRAYALEDEIEVILVSSTAPNNLWRGSWRAAYNVVEHIAGSNANSDLWSIDGTQVRIFYANDTTLDPEMLAVNAITRPRATILEDPDISAELQQLSNLFEFNRMFEIIDSFINKNELSEIDRTYQLKDLAKRGAYLMTLTNTITDSYDNSMRIYYPGVTQISRNINNVPYINISSRGTVAARHEIGFIQNDWLFFRRTSLRIREDNFIEINHNYSDINRTVLAGEISEVIDISLNSRLRGLNESDTIPVIRFINEHGDYHQHTLTTAEINALSVISELIGIHTQMSNIFRLSN